MRFISKGEMSRSTTCRRGAEIDFLAISRFYLEPVLSMYNVFRFVQYHFMPPLAFGREM